MSKAYSEDKLIEGSCMKLLAELGWETANVYGGEEFGLEGTLGRLSEADVLLKGRFLDAVRSLNPKLPSQALEEAYELINSRDITKGFAEINRDKYALLKDGIPVDYKDDKGKVHRSKRVKVYDFDHPSNNNFIAVQQLWVEGKSKRRRRTDIVGFVNGIPLVFIELKSPKVQVRAAYEDNLKDYKDAIPHIFHCNAFVILSNGIETKVGSITAKFEHYNDWKRIVEDEEGDASLETALRGTCEKGRLIDLFENFILYSDKEGSISKLVARNHQFIGVNKAIDHLRQQKNRLQNGLIGEEVSRKLGVYWHTQGSGKSYSMVFLCQKILRVLGGGYSFLIVTDRAELDKQIYGTFSGVGAVSDKSSRATSGQHLKELLSTDRRYIFSLIHKFNFEDYKNERSDIIVISDEAHRTQGGTLAMTMRDALPNASFIGFTGTPLFKDDEITKRIFGNYVSKYDFKRSIEDGATVPLYYENRGEKLKLENPEIDEQIRNKIEEFDLDDDQEEKLKHLFKREYPILTAEKRLKSIARDVVEHFNTRGYKGKAMFIAIDKVTAVRMHDYIVEAWEAYLENELRLINSIVDETEQKLRLQEWEWSKETEIAVVVSEEQNEIDKFRQWGLDIEPHRVKMKERDLEQQFKDEGHPFRFTIVCAMWITGFDVPSLSTLYLDKPLKSHTLMQAIARANRVHKGKNNGLIVDYIETYKSLLEALAIYGASSTRTDEPGGEEKPVQPLEELKADLEEVIKATELFLENECDSKLSAIYNSKDFAQIKELKNAFEKVSKSDETKKKFGILAREVFKKYKALMPDKSVYDYAEKRDAINTLYSMFTQKVRKADITNLVKQVQDLVNESINTYNVALDKVEDFGSKIDLSSLNFKKIEEEFLKLDGSKNIAVQSLKDRVEKKLNKMIDQNPLRINFYERYQEIIEEYNRGLEYAEIKKIFDELLLLYGELSIEEKRAVKEELSEEELTIFDYLSKNKKIGDKEKSKLKIIARQLLEKLKGDLFTVERWWENTFVCGKVRKEIDDTLYVNLPFPLFSDGDRAIKGEILFDYFKNQESQNIIHLYEDPLSFGLAAEP